MIKNLILASLFTFLSAATFADSDSDNAWLAQQNIPDSVNSFLVLEINHTYGYATMSHYLNKGPHEFSRMSYQTVAVLEGQAVRIGRNANRPRLSVTHQELGRYDHTNTTSYRLPNSFPGQAVIGWTSTGDGGEHNPQEMYILLKEVGTCRSAVGEQ